MTVATRFCNGIVAYAANMHMLLVFKKEACYSKQFHFKDLAADSRMRNS
jgi:hypothetical protein